MFYKKVAHKILSKFTCNFIQKETPTNVYFCEFNEILWKTYLAEHLRMAGSGFCTVLYVSLHNLFNQAEQWERKLFLFEYIQQDFNIGELSPKEIIKFENATFRYVFFRQRSTWNHSLGHGSWHEMNDWMKIFDLLQIKYKLATSN